MSRRILITGATSGLGRELALQLARESDALALTGRREERLRQVADCVRTLGGHRRFRISDVEKILAGGTADERILDE